MCNVTFSNGGCSSYPALLKWVGTGGTLCAAEVCTTAMESPVILEHAQGCRQLRLQL